MAKVPPNPLLILLLTTGAVLGCGTLPAASRTWRFNVTGFSLPVAMAFSADAAARAQVLDVLEQQGRAAGLPDFVTTTILGQLGINVLYTPLSCPVVSLLTQQFLVPAGADVNCRLDMPMDFTPIPPQHLSISGTLTTSNAIMATWSREMWQSVVNRVLRMIHRVRLERSSPRQLPPSPKT
ncbi:hypothetical protein KIN20_014278 [Parelaphostrongylus tenuis]|uniref:Lipoprotein n=1 Tax=Parelaphostrongylus tenuis TaxID=148309 RepID=A0AAD5QLJ6_PARTN|nr:hypothetical protein KIN20_014278 [Parelaphostrongylus tenuis]